MDTKSKVFLVALLCVFTICVGITTVLADTPPPKGNYDYWINAQKGLEIIANTKFATGIDVSKWRGELLNLNFEDKTISKILDFIIIRAGYVAFDTKTITTDEQFENNYKMLEDNPEVIRGVYWYNASFYSWEEQFDFFVDQLETKDFDFIALDYEDMYNDMSADFADDTVLFMDALIEEFPTKKVFLYSHRHFYDEFIAGRHEPFNLWVAEYPKTHWTSISHWNVHNFLTKVMDGTYQPQMPRTLFQDDWEIWQFADRTGIGHLFGIETDNVDINVTKRTYQEFVKFVGIPERWKDKTIVAKLLESEPALNTGIRMENVNPWILDRLGQYAYENNCDYWVAKEDVECDWYPCIQELDFTREHGYLLEENADHSFDIDLLRLRPAQLIGVTVELDRQLNTQDGFWNEPFLGADIELGDLSEGVFGYLDEDRLLDIRYQIYTPANIIYAEFMICEIIEIDP